MSKNIDYYLDITGDVCPMTFVKTKLLIERMNVGETCEIRLKGMEPLINVPRSARELGHVTQEPVREPGEGENGIHRLVIIKSK